MKNVKTKAPLTEHQAKVLSAFKRRNHDTTISSIFMVTYGHDAWNETGTVREMQQKLAPTFAEINDKLEPPDRIEPGKFKQTYRYSTASKG